MVTDLGDVSIHITLLVLSIISTNSYELGSFQQTLHDANIWSAEASVG